MKRLFTLLFFVLFALSSYSQALLVENFSYTTGTPLTDNGWIVTAANTTNPVSVVTPGLTYTGYSGSGIGNATSLTTTGQDVYKDMSSIVTTGNVYASFMINVSSAQATGDYFFAFSTSTNTTGYIARVFIKSSGTGFVLGLGKASDPAITYGTTVYNFGTTYLLVAKYSFVAVTTTDDIVSLYVFASGVPATEPLTAEVGPVVSTATDATNISRAALRQGTATSAPALTVDGFRIATDWFNAPLPVKLKSFSASLINGKASLAWSTTNEVNVNGFAIEKSKDGSNFSQLDFIAAKNATSNTYAYTDAVAATGTTYYRLKMTDKDGSFKYSQSVALNAKQSIKLDVFPNPVSTTAILSHTKAESNASVTLVTVEGKTIATYTVQVGATQTSVDVSQLTRGNYVVVFENGAARSFAQFVKQ